MIEYKTKYSRTLHSHVQYLEICEGVNLVFKRKLLFKRVFIELKINGIEILIQWGTISLNPHQSINALIYDLCDTHLGQWHIYDLAYSPNVHPSSYKFLPEL